MNIDILKSDFHKLIDDLDNEPLLEHFFVLMSNLNSNDSVYDTLNSDCDVNYSDDFSYDNAAAQ